MVAFAFNAQQFEPKYSGGSGLTVGRHRVIIVDTEGMPTKKGDGGYLKLTIKDIDNGQQGMDNLNIWNPSPLAVEIANKQLSAYCHAVNVFNVQDTAQLHNIPFQVEVGPQKDNPQYTEIVGVFDINGNAPGAKAAAPVVAAPAPAPAAPAAPVAAAPAAWPGTAPAAEAAPAGWPGATAAAPAAAAAPVAPWAK